MNTILITGATGAIGSALIPCFLSDRKIRLRLLIRANDETHLLARMKALYSFWGDANPDSLDRIDALRGDVTQPMLGMKDCEYQKLIQEVTHIVHCAGNVKLNQTLDDARRSAVDSVRHVTALARACKASGQFCKLDYVSTIGVAGRMKGLIPEIPLTGVCEFHNTYEAAKAEAEAWLLGEMKNGLSATIHRPSMVVGNSQTGRIIQFQVFYYLIEFLSGRRTWGIVPETGAIKLDIIPVDYVARAIYLASRHGETAGRIFHLCAGPRHAISIREMTLTVRAILKSYGELLPRCRRIHPIWLKRFILIFNKVTIGKTRRALQSLPYFLEYLDEESEFDNSASNAFFSAHGLRVPAMNDYLGNVLRYYVNNKLKKSAPQTATLPSETQTHVTG